MKHELISHGCLEKYELIERARKAMQLAQNCNSPPISYRVNKSSLRYRNGLSKKNRLRQIYSIPDKIPDSGISYYVQTRVKELEIRSRQCNMYKHNNKKPRYNFRKEAKKRKPSFKE